MITDSASHILSGLSTTIFFFISCRVLIIVSIGVIAACLLCSIMVLICCFWSRCPLHTACSVNYKHNDDIVFCKWRYSEYSQPYFMGLLLHLATKEEKQKLNGMPDEEYGDHKSNPIKIRPVVDVWTSFFYILRLEKDLVSNLFFKNLKWHISFCNVWISYLFLLPTQEKWYEPYSDLVQLVFLLIWSIIINILCGT